MCCSLGDGLSINPFCDPWIPTVTGGILRRKEGVDLPNLLRVFQIKMEEANDWNLELIKQIMEEELVTAIKNIKWPNFRCSVKLCWTGNSKGRFSVSSCYHFNFRGN